MGVTAMSQRGSECWTFEQYIMNLINTGQTKSKQFQTMIEIFGREKLIKIYKKNRSETPEPTRQGNNSRYERDIYEWKKEVLQASS